MPAHCSYVVRIDAFAHPAMPETTSDELDETDLEAQMRELIEQMKHLTSEELQDQVHRRLEFNLCRPCQVNFLSNPLGRPSENRASNN